MELVHAPAPPRAAAPSPDPLVTASPRRGVLRDLIAATNAGASLPDADHAIWEDACRRLAAEQRPEPLPPAPSAGPKNVLIVDASSAVRETLQHTLRTAGYGVAVAADAARALAFARQGPADLIIIDVELPATDGLALIAQLRGLRRSTPILMLTGAAQDGRKVAGHSAGATGWVTKPVDPPRLVAIARQLCPI